MSSEQARKSGSYKLQKLSFVQKFALGDTSDGISEVFSVKYSPDGLFLAVACGDCAIRIYSAATGKLSFVLSPIGKYTKLPVTNIRFRPSQPDQKNRNVLVATYAEGSIRQWLITQAKCTNIIYESDNYIYALDYAPDATKFCSGGKDYKLRLYDENTKQLISTYAKGEHELSGGHSNRVYAVHFHPKDDIIISGGWDDTVQFWDFRSGECVRSIVGPHLCGDSLGVQQTEVLTGSWRPEQQIQLWDYGTGKPIKNIPWSESVVEECLIYTARYSRRGEGEWIFAAGSGSSEARVFDKKSSSLIGVIPDIPRSTYTLDLDPTNSAVAIGGSDGLTRVYQLQWGH